MQQPDLVSVTTRPLVTIPAATNNREMNFTKNVYSHTDYRSLEDESRRKCRNVMCMKYTPDGE
jgi:hypothetical protein